MFSQGIRLEEFGMLLEDSVGRAGELQPLRHWEFLNRRRDISFVGHYPKSNRCPAIGADELHHLVEAETGGRVFVAAGRREKTLDDLIVVAPSAGEILERGIIEVEGFHRT